MAELGVDEPAVRSSISRLKRRGILESERVGTAAGYGLSGAGREILDEGDRRIFRRPARAARRRLAAGGVQRAGERARQAPHAALPAGLAGLRHRGGGRLDRAGHLYDETRDMLERHGLTEYVDLFRADYLAFGDVEHAVTTWWDLDAGCGTSTTSSSQAARRCSPRWRRRRRLDDAAGLRRLRPRR